MKKTTSTIVMAMLCIFSKVDAQFYEPSQKSLYVGDTVPDSFYKLKHDAVEVKTETQKKLTLEEFKNKLVILDFWATWCKPCLGSLNELDRIQTKLTSKEVIVIPVTYQTREQASPVFKRFKWNMSSIVSDTILSQIFPTGGIPHQIWIKNGRVIAIPEPASASSDQIEKVIKGDPYSGKMKLVRLNYKTTKPMFNNGNIGTGEGILIQSSFTGYKDELLQHKLEAHFNKDTSTIYAHNVEFTSLYYEAFKEEIFKEFNKQNSSGLILEIGPELRARMDKSFNKVEDKTTRDSLLTIWKQNNWYCYNLFCSFPVSESTAKEKMQQDLNSFFGLRLRIEGKIETRKITFAILSRIANPEDVRQKLKTKHSVWLRVQDDPKGYTFQNDYFDALTSLVLNKVTPYQILDETGIDKLMKVDFEFSTKINNNLLLAHKELSKYGLDFTLQEREVPVLVITEQQPSTFIGEE